MLVDPAHQRAPRADRPVGVGTSSRPSTAGRRTGPAGPATPIVLKHLPACRVGLSLAPRRPFPYLSCAMRPAPARRPSSASRSTASRPAATPSCPGTRCARTTAMSIAAAGGLPIALPHEPDLAEHYLALIDGLVVTGGAFDVDPALYGGGERHDTVRLKERRTRFEWAITQGAVERDLPVLGICGGQQLLNVVLGGTLIQHIPDAVPDALAARAAQPAHRARPRGRGRCRTRCCTAITGADRLPVNSAHHQAVERVGAGDRGQRHGAGRRDRGDRGSDAALLPRRAVAPRIRHQPRRHGPGRGLRRGGGAAMSAVDAASAGRSGRGRADRQADRARRPVLAPRRRGLDRRPPGRGRRHGAGDAGASGCGRASGSPSTASRCRRPRRPACSATTSPRAW